MASVRIETDTREIEYGNLTMVAVQQLVQTITGAVAIAGGPVLVEWHPGTPDPVRVTMVDRDGAMLFRRKVA